MRANNSINNTVGTSNTGPNTLTVQNTSSAASSRANVNIVVGDSTAGTSSGSPWTQYTIQSAGGPSYAVGVANQAYTLSPNPPGYTLPQQTLVINTSSTNGVVSPTSGSTTWSMGIGTNNLPCINLPTQPAFYYYYSAPTAGVTGDGTNYILGSSGTFTRMFDQGINNSGVYTPNVSAGVFTVPVAGIYLLSAGIVIQNANINNNLAQLEIINASGQQFTLHLLSLNNIVSANPPTYSMITGGGRVGMRCACYVQANAGDQFKAAILVGGSASKNVAIFGSGSQFFSFFGGHLVA